MKHYKKIDLYYDGNYLYSTNMSNTCKDAIVKLLLIRKDLDYKKLKAYFA